MKKHFSLCIVLISCFTFCSAQSTEAFQRYHIENSGMSVNFPSTPVKWKSSFSEDSSAIYSNSVFYEEKTYSVFALKLIDSLHPNEVEGVLKYYIDELKNDYRIIKTNGSLTGIKLSHHPKAVGVEEFWLDHQNRNIWIRGWGDTKQMGILLIISKFEITSNEFALKFLNSFSFKGDKL